MVRVARSRADLAVVDADDPHARTLAAALRACGVPVWWVAPDGSRCPGAGAPAQSSTTLDAALLASAAELAGRPGAGVAAVAVAETPVSVVVTTLDEGSALDTLVAGVIAQLGPDDELVVIDGGSTDGSVERVTAIFVNEPRLRLQQVPGAGISAGRNLGVRAAAYDVVVCTDAGCAIAPGWLEAMRRAFAVADPPGLVSGPYRPVGPGLIDQAQAWACYPDPHEVRRRDLAVRAWTRLFGTGFDPRFSIGRNVAFTRAAWTDAGGFPEHLPTGEDVSFGLAVARTHRCVGAADAEVAWVQRDSLGATWRMYRSYGRASTDGGDPRLLVRDGVRGTAYVVGATLAARGPRGRAVAAVGAACYLALPVRRAARAGARPGVYPLLPVALATKDSGKLAGAVQGYVRARRTRRTRRDGSAR